MFNPFASLDDDEQNTRDPFGRVMPKAEPDHGISNLGNPAVLEQPVGEQGKNVRRDVAKIETMLGQAGTLDLKKTDGPTGYWGERTREATRTFQKQDGLKVDGQINPGGETVRALSKIAGSVTKALVSTARHPGAGRGPEYQPEPEGAGDPSASKNKSTLSGNLRGISMDENGEYYDKDGKPINNPHKNPNQYSVQEIIPEPVAGDDASYPLKVIIRPSDISAEKSFPGEAGNPKPNEQEADAEKLEQVRNSLMKKIIDAGIDEKDALKYSREFSIKDLNDFEQLLKERARGNDTYIEKLLTWLSGKMFERRKDDNILKTPGANPPRG